MSQQLNQHQTTLPIPFLTVPIQQQPVGNNQIINRPSIDRLPSSMNELGQSIYHNPSMASIASINYGQQDNQQQQNIQQNQQQNANNQIQEQQLQKVSLQKNQIDQDQIIRMFRQQDDRKQKRQKELAQIKKKNSQQAGGNKDSGRQKDRKGAVSSSGNKKQSALGQDGNNVFKTFKQQHDLSNNNLTGLNRLSSVKDIKQSVPSIPVVSQYLNQTHIQKMKWLVMQYKIQYRSSMFDMDWQRQRYKLKQQFFQYLCMGCFEILQRTSQDTDYTLVQKQITNTIQQINQTSLKTSYNFGVFKYCRNLVGEIDMELFIHFHQKSKQPLNKDYKTQYKYLLSNLKDVENFELRKKVLSREMDSEIIKLANQIEFFKESKRKEIRQKEQKLLNQFSADRESNILKTAFDNQQGNQKPKKKSNFQTNTNKPQFISTSPNKKLSSSKNISSPHQRPQLIRQSSNSPFPSSGRTPMSTNMASHIASINKYLDQSTLSTLQELLSTGQLNKMKRRLQQDLKGELKQRMVKKFDQAMILLEE